MGSTASTAQAIPAQTSTSTTEQDDDQGSTLLQLPDVVTVGAVPWGDPRTVVATAKQWMSPEAFREAGEYWMEQLKSDG
jgi:hypothetical protein